MREGKIHALRHVVTVEDLLLQILPKLVMIVIQCLVMGAPQHVHWRQDLLARVVTSKTEMYATKYVEMVKIMVIMHAIQVLSWGPWGAQPPVKLC